MCGRTTGLVPVRAGTGLVPGLPGGLLVGRAGGTAGVPSRPGTIRYRGGNDCIQVPGDHMQGPGPVAGARAGQDRAGRGRAGQGGAGQGGAGRGRAGQGQGRGRGRAGQGQGQAQGGGRDGAPTTRSPTRSPASVVRRWHRVVVVTERQRGVQECCVGVTSFHVDNDSVGLQGYAKQCASKSSKRAYTGERWHTRWRLGAGREDEDAHAMEQTGAGRREGGTGAPW